MNRVQRKIAYGLAATLLILSFVLVFFPAETESHYLVEASWQADYISDSVLQSTVLQQSGWIFRLKTREISQSETIPITFDLTHKNTGGQADLEIQANTDSDAVTVLSGAEHTTIPADGNQHSYTVKLQVNHVTKEKTASVQITASSSGETRSATFRVTIKPAGSGTVEPTEKKSEFKDLFAENESMDSYTWGTPFCEAYAIARPGTLYYAAGTTGDSFGAFPAYTTYRMGNGETVTLYEPDVLPLEADSGAVVFDLSRVTAMASAPSAVRLKLKTEDGNWQIKNIALQASDTLQNRFDENGIPAVYVAGMDKCGQPEVRVEHLTWDESKNALQYQVVTDKFAMKWDEQDNNGGQYLHLNSDGNTIAAGSYRVILTWKLGAVTVYTQNLPFYVYYI